MWAHIFACRRMRGWCRAGEAAAAAPPGAEACGALLYPAASDFTQKENGQSRQSGQCAENPCSVAAADSASGCTAYVASPAVAATPGASAAEKSGGASGGGRVVAPSVAHLKEVRQVWVVTMHRQATHLDLSAQMLETLPSSISHLRALRKLTLDDNMLRSVTARTLLSFFLAPLPFLSVSPLATMCTHTRDERRETIRTRTVERDTENKAGMCSDLPSFLASPGLPNLRELSCDKNRLTEVPAVVASEGMRQLRLLSLANNYLAEVPVWVSSLEALILKVSSIVALYSQYNRSLTLRICKKALKTLNLEGNRLVDLPLALRALTRLMSLNLAHNCLDLLPLYVPRAPPPLTSALLLWRCAYSSCVCMCVHACMSVRVCVCVRACVRLLLWRGLHTGGLCGGVHALCSGVHASTPLHTCQWRQCTRTHTRTHRCVGEMPGMQTVDVRGNRLRGLSDWLDCPELCQELIESNGSSQLATMCWGATFSCRICQVLGPSSPQ